MLWSEAFWSENPTHPSRILGSSFQISPATLRLNRSKPKFVFALLRRPLNPFKLCHALRTLDGFRVIEPFHRPLAKTSRNSSRRFTPRREF